MKNTRKFRRSIRMLARYFSQPHILCITHEIDIEEARRLFAPQDTQPVKVEVFSPLEVQVPILPKVSRRQIVALGDTRRASLFRGSRR